MTVMSTEEPPAYVCVGGIIIDDIVFPTVEEATPFLYGVTPEEIAAAQVYRFDDPAALVRAMLDDGAKIAALRLGEAGSLVGQRESGPLLKIPAVPVPEIVDQTGAGNTYCGAFLVGWLETGDLKTAACYGAVAASFALEVIGVADPPANVVELRDQRWRWRCNRIETSS
jgi:sugar/nucleoside kinase (ribokinase family)